MNTYNVNARQGLACRDLYLDENYISFFIQYDGDLTSELREIDYACAYRISPVAYIVSVRSDRSIEFFNNFKGILNLDVSFPYTLSAIQPVNAANIPQFHSEISLGLKGSGTVVGVIDTGIDYLNPQFLNDDNTSRIIAIWDQTIQSDKPYNEQAFYGTVYSQDEINKAISASLSGGNPYDIVPSRDLIGHGTNMAGLVGAKGLNGVLGGAPDCEFVIIKLKEAKTSNLKLVGINNRMGTNIYEGIDLYTALIFLEEYHVSLNKPMSILISCGTNWGGHEGLSSIEQDIDFLSSRRGLVFVTNTGNQGASSTHASGRFLSTNSLEVIEFNVAPNEENLVLMLWIINPDVVSIAIISPSGEIVKSTQPQLQYGSPEIITLVLENSVVNITNRYAEFSTGNQNVTITIKNPKEGLWQLRLKGEYIVNGKYNLWLPQRPLLQPNTLLVNASPYTTIMSPANALKAITTSFYNQNNNTIAIESGRGFTAIGDVKPDLTTGGVMALTTGLNNETTVISGGSVAGAVLCGATLILMEWGIVLGNAPNMSGPAITSFLTRGTNKRAGDIYPNREWGYGMLNLQGSYENLRSTTLSWEDNISPQSDENHLPYKCYVKMPKELYRRLNDVAQEDKI